MSSSRRHPGHRTPTLFLLAVLVCLVGAGFYLGSRYQRGASADKAPYKELEKFSKVLQFIENNYVEDVKPKDLLEGAIRGMLATLDPHSAYMPADVFKEMKVETSGKFGGLGLEVTAKDGIITVVSPIDDTPAFRAGIKTGDQILRIAGKSTKNFSLPEAINIMRGKPGSKISLTVFRKGTPKPIDYELVRESIKLQSVKSLRLPSNLGYVRISSFMERTGEEVAKALEKLNQPSKIDGVILDLRGNPGGLLDQAVRVANLFVDEGPVVYTIGRDKSKKEVEFAQKGRRMTDLPLVVLVDGSSASASEIVAGALQDYGRGIIAGQQTFGKGSVQTVIPLGDESGLKITVSRYYTPSGRSIQVTGITPDVKLDYIDPKVVEEARRNQKRLREADLENHFANEADPDADKDGEELATSTKAKPEEVAAKAKKDSTGVPPPPMPLEERVKKDYMIVQAEGIVRTMAVVRKGLKTPEFKLQEGPEEKAAKNAKSASM